VALGRGGVEDGRVAKHPAYAGQIPSFVSISTLLVVTGALVTVVSIDASTYRSSAKTMISGLPVFCSTQNRDGRPEATAMY
jgi:hypothetical protein